VRPSAITGPKRLIVDLRGLTFMDSTGVRLLIELHRSTQRDAVQLSLVRPPAPVDTTIQTCGLDTMLPFVAAAGPELDQI